MRERHSRPEAVLPSRCERMLVCGGGSYYRLVRAGALYLSFLEMYERKKVAVAFDTQSDRVPGTRPKHGWRDQHRSQRCVEPAVLHGVVHMPVGVAVAPTAGHLVPIEIIALPCGPTVHRVLGVARRVLHLERVRLFTSGFPKM